MGDVKRAGIARNSVRFGLWAYLLTLGMVLGLAATAAALSEFSTSLLGAWLRDGAILLGLFWIVAGFLAGASVNAYIGPGRAEDAAPMIWPASVVPEREDAVLEDLKMKLSDPQNLSVLFVALGILGVVVGFIAYASAFFGALAIFTLAAGVAGLLMATVPRSRPVVSR